MNKELLLSCALLALPAPQASADGNGGLDLTAVACNTNTTPPPSTTFNFDCADPGVPQTVFACFQITTTQDSVVGLDAHLELTVDDPGLPDWWHFESGGCNAGGVLLDLVPSTSLCVGATNPWETGNMAFAPGDQGPNSGHFVVSVSRPTPIKLNAGTNYFAFNLNFFSDNATQSGGKCGGCGIAAVLAWASTPSGQISPPAAALINIRTAAQAGGEAAPYVISGPGLVGNTISFAVAPTPTRNRTWGQLKSLYR